MGYLRSPLADLCKIRGGTVADKLLDVFFEELLDLFDQAALPLRIGEDGEVEVLPGLVASVHCLAVEFVALAPVPLRASDAVLLDLDRLCCRLVHPQEGSPLHAHARQFPRLLDVTLHDSPEKVPLSGHRYFVVDAGLAHVEPEGCVVHPVDRGYVDDGAEALTYACLVWRLLLFSQLRHEKWMP